DPCRHRPAGVRRTRGVDRGPGRADRPVRRRGHRRFGTGAGGGGGPQPAAAAGADRRAGRRGARRMTREGTLDVVGLLARLALGGVLLAAGLLKIGDLTGSVQSVIAYELFPYEVSRFLGTVLPILEIALGVLLVLGLFTRVSALLGGLLMLVFVAGIVSA